MPYTLYTPRPDTLGDKNLYVRRANCFYAPRTFQRTIISHLNTGCLKNSSLLVKAFVLKNVVVGRRNSTTNRTHEYSYTQCCQSFEAEQIRIRLYFNFPRASRFLNTLYIQTKSRPTIS
jgi:hypothetical protein